jgi:hypothetical protein
MDHQRIFLLKEKEKKKVRSSRKNSNTIFCYIAES